MLTRSVGIMAALAIILLAGGFGWLIRHRQSAVGTAQPIREIPDDIELRLHKVRLHGISGGKIIWDIEAEDFNLEKKRPILRITGLKKVAVLNEGKQELSLTADLLERNKYTGAITLRGKVTVMGKDLLLRTPEANWDPIRETLNFPAQFSAQLGDILLKTPNGVALDVNAQTLNCSGGIVLTYRGNTLQAGGVKIDIPRQRCELFDMVSAKFDVADLEAWGSGRRLPEIPPIPPGIRQRYLEYQRQQEAKRHPTPVLRKQSSGQSPPLAKGARP